ncbi:hypothetical protein D770_17815 [Flammeovirgaceae bacterium 311]|nr:hypothetical protein D770_17815 [Flammeovirgaceae bacterium 311]
MSYDEYMQLIEEELAQGRTTGTDQSEWLVDYARLNLQRMQRLNKTLVLLEELRQALDKLQQPQLWVVLTEGWCGDAAQIVPVLAKVAAYSHKIGLKLLLRDEYPQVMDAYLTNGTRSIPKLIALEPEHLQELGTWGPRPKAAQDVVNEFKSNPQGRTKEDFTYLVHKWYADNKTLDTQHELLESLQQWDTINNKKGA